MNAIKQVNHTFGSLFKKYRLLSQIETLSRFGDLLAEEGIVYETSLFTRWQKGSRLPKDRYVILKVIRVFAKRSGFQTITEVNSFLESAGQGYLTKTEQPHISQLIY